MTMTLFGVDEYKYVSSEGNHFAIFSPIGLVTSWMRVTINVSMGL